MGDRSTFVANEGLTIAFRVVVCTIFPGKRCLDEKPLFCAAYARFLWGDMYYIGCVFTARFGLGTAVDI